MKKISAFLIIICLFSRTYGQALPDVPRKVDFAGVSVKLDADAQKAVKDEIKFLLTPENRILQEKLERIQWYFPVIEAILEEEEVPEDFKYLAVVESSLMPDAISNSNAIGFWQLKAETASELGLQINNQVDERKNIYASTKAAALYLKRNNLIYKNWISTLYSYYLGATGVSKLVPSEWAYSTEIKLDANTDRYIIKTIAHRIAFEFRLNRLRESPNAFIEYKKSKGKTLNQIAADLDLDANDLKKYNTWLSSNSIPTDKDYSVAILSATENVEKIQSKIKNVFSPIVEKSDSGFPILKKTTVMTSSPAEPIFYEINDKKGILAQSGDDVASLAQKGDITVNKFLDINDMNDKDLIKEGKIYYLKRKDKHAKVPFHNVTEDQTLWEISQMYGITMFRLMKYNRMNTIQRLQAGRVLWLQKTRPKDQPIEYIIDKDKENTTVVNKPLDEKIDKVDDTNVYKPTKSSTVETDPDEREATTPSTSSPSNETSENSKKGPIVILEEETPHTSTVSEKTKKKETPKTEPKVIVPSKPIEKVKEADNTKEAEIIILEDNGKELTPNKTTTQPNVTSTNNSVVYNSSNVHTVVPGETLYSIARNYNVAPRDLAAWNNFTITEKVKIGQQVIIATPNQTIVEKPKVQPKATYVAPVQATTAHVVVKGETLFSIAKKYGATMKEIQQWNGMTDQNVKIGQRLVIRK